MRRQPKVPPPPPPKPDPLVDDPNSSTEVIEHVLSDNLEPGTGVTTPPQLSAMFEMCVAFAFDKGVTRAFFLDVLDKAFRAQALTEGLKSEYRLIRALDLPDDKKAAMAAALELSGKEITALRRQLYDAFALMRQCKGPGAKLN